MVVEVVGEQERRWVNKWNFYSYFLYLTVVFFFNLENRVTFIIKQKLLNSLIWEDTCMETANPLKANTQPA